MLHVYTRRNSEDHMYINSNLSPKIVDLALKNGHSDTDLSAKRQT